MPENINDQNPVITYNLNKPMKFSEFRKLPEKAKAEYIKKLRKEFGCGVGQMAAMFECDKEDIIREAELLGLNIRGTRQMRDDEKLKAWLRFVGDEEPTEANPEPKKGTEPKEAEKVSDMDELEKEIRDLENSPLVKLARLEDQIRQRRLQYRDQLRTLKKRGEALVQQGWSLEMIEEASDGTD